MGDQESCLMVGGGIINGHVRGWMGGSRVVFKGGWDDQESYLRVSEIINSRV